MKNIQKKTLLASDNTNESNQNIEIKTNINDIDIHQNVKFSDLPEMSDEMSFDEGKIKCKGIVNSRSSSNLKITLYVQSEEYCINNIQYNGKTYNTHTDDNWLEMQFDCDADYEKPMELVINFSSGKKESIQIPLNNFKIQNTAPQAPKLISYGFKKINIKAESKDAENDKIKYVWEGTPYNLSHFNKIKHYIMTI